MSGEWLGTADVPLPDPHARMPGFPYEPHPPCVEGDQEPSSGMAAAPAVVKVSSCNGFYKKEGCKR